MPDPLTHEELQKMRAHALELIEMGCGDVGSFELFPDEALLVLDAAEERDSLKTELDQTRALWQAETTVSAEWCAKAIAAQQEVERLQSRVRELEAALRPFADACGFGPEWNPDEFLGYRTLRVGDLQRAAALVDGEAPGHMIEGDHLDSSIARFQHRADVLLQELQEQPSPPNHLIAFICDAVRLSRENTRLARTRLGVGTALVDGEEE